MIFSLYFRTLISLSISFLLHAFNFKKHLHSFLTLLTTPTFNNNATTDNNKILLKCQLHPPNMNSTSHVPIHDLMVCRARIDDDQACHEFDDEGDSEDEYEDGCLRGWAEGREITFPPPLSSLNGNGQPNFILLPVRKNGRLQLSKVRIKRPEILCGTREDGRLRLYLIPDHQYSSILDDEEHDEIEEEEEDSSRNEEDDRVRENNNEGLLYIRRCHSVGDNEKLVRKCHQMVNHTASIHYNHNLYGSHHHMFGVSVA